MFQTMMYLASTSMFSFIRICGAPAGNRTQIRRLEISYSILWTIGATYQSVIHWASQVGTASGIRTHKILILSETRMPIPSWRHESLTNYQRTKLTYSFNINILYHNIDILYTKIGPGNGTRTRTPIREADFKSAASANSTIPGGQLPGTCILFTSVTNWSFTT